MREILFRGKRKDNGEWVEGDFMQHYVHHNDLTIVVGGCVYHEVDSQTVGQFTGLTDKKGTKIFEGDIVKMKYVPIGANPEVIEYYYIGYVVWEYASWEVAMYKEGTKIIDSSRALSHHETKEEFFRKGRGYIYHSPTFKSLEVIGTIYDNKNLIE